MLELPDRFDPNVQPLERSLEDEEGAEYIRLLRDVLCLSEDDISKVKQEVEEGSDELLKVPGNRSLPLETDKDGWRDPPSLVRRTARFSRKGHNCREALIIEHVDLWEDSDSEPFQVVRSFSSPE